MLSITARLAIAAIFVVPTLVFLLARYRRHEVDRVFPGLLTKGYRQTVGLESEQRATESELVEELSTLGTVLTSKRTWLSTASLQILIIAAILMFYLSAIVLAWRISRNIVNSGAAHSANVSVSDGNATLEGPVSTEDSYIEASRKAVEIVGPGHVINRMQVQNPDVLGELSDQLGKAQLEIDTLYDDSPESVRQITTVVDLPLFQIVAVKSKDHIEQIVNSHFGIEISKLPDSFRIVGHRIANLNNQNLPPLSPGYIRIPILPTRFKGKGNPANTSYRARRKSIIAFQSTKTVDSLLEVKMSGRPRTALSRRVLLQIPFTRGTAVKTPGNAQVLESSMTIQFASAGPAGPVHMTLEGADGKAVIDALNRKARRQATVFVLDSGWPDKLSYQSSVDELRKLVDTASNFYNIDKAQWLDQPFVPLAPDAKSQHCVYIQNSLDEFTKLDTRHLVKVVYVPLDTRQNAQQLLHEMLRLYRIRAAMLGDTQVDEGTKKAAQDFATQTLSSIEAGEPFDLEQSNSAKPSSSYHQRWRTNSAVAAAVWYLAELAAEQDPQNPVFFLNESWTVIHDTVELDAPGVSSGIVVAAAGNTPGKEINTDTGKIDFARRATPPKNVLAALDTKPGLNQPFCDSSQLGQNSLSITMAASYDGEVVSNGLCGTSFSAPRIAWLLALREATRAEDLQLSEWAGRLQEKLKAIRGQSTSMFEVLYLHPKDLLQ